MVGIPARPARKLYSTSSHWKKTGSGKPIRSMACRNQARPPAVVFGIHATFRQFLEHTSVANTVLIGRYTTLKRAKIHAFTRSQQVVGVEQEQHLGADQSRFRRHVRERTQPKNRFGFAENVVVHQDHVSVRTGRRSLVEASGESTRTTQVRLPQILQPRTELLRHFLEQLTALYRIRSLIDDVQSVEQREYTLVGREGLDRARTVVRAIERADRDGYRANRLRGDDGPFHVVDHCTATLRFELQPQRTAVDEGIERSGHGHSLVAGHDDVRHDATVATDVRGLDLDAASGIGHDMRGDSDLGDVGPALPVAGRKSAEEGVGVCDCPRLKSQFEPRSRRHADLGHRIQFVTGDGRGSGEQRPLRQQSIRRRAAFDQLDSGIGLVIGRVHGIHAPQGIANPHLGAPGTESHQVYPRLPATTPRDCSQQRRSAARSFADEATTNPSPSGSRPWARYGSHAPDDPR